MTMVTFLRGHERFAQGQRVSLRAGHAQSLVAAGIAKYSGESEYVAVRKVDSSATLDRNDYSVICDATNGEITLTLPTAASATERVYEIKKIDSTGNRVVVDAGSDEIDGQSTQWLNSQHDCLTILSDGTDWRIT